MVSIIVPVFRAEKYLPACLDSILAQSVKEWELIAVDDGSPDRSGAICRDYARRDGRIRVLHREWEGAPRACNTGLRHARGEWVTFVEADARLEPDFLEKLLDCLARTGADLCQCPALPGQSGPERCLDGADALRELIREGLFCHQATRTLYRRSLLEGLHFPAGRTHADAFLTYQAFGRAKKAAWIPQALYYTRVRRDRPVCPYHPREGLDALEAKAKRQTYLELQYPDLAAEGKIDLYHSCVYVGQRMDRELQGPQREMGMALAEHYARQYGLDRHQRRQLRPGERMWYGLFRRNFRLGCRLRTCLGQDG